MVSTLKASTPEGSHRRTRFERLLKVLRRSPVASGAVIVFALYILLAVAAPLVSPADPLYMFAGDELMPPSLQHPLGTDEFGRDLWSRIAHGARVSLLVGFSGVFAAALVGTMLGLLSGFAGPGSLLDLVVMRVMDTLLAFPGILIGIIAVVLLGAGPRNVAVAVAIAHTPLMTRLVRGEVLRERERDYIQAARAIGARDFRILLAHLLPNSLGVIIVQMATSVAVAILLEAALSFLGLGTQPPTPSWGAMLRDARPYLRQAPWYALAPGIALSLLITSVNFTANALRRSLDRSR